MTTCIRVLLNYTVAVNDVQGWIYVLLLIDTLPIAWYSHSNFGCVSWPHSFSALISFLILPCVIVLGFTPYFRSFPTLMASLPTGTVTFLYTDIEESTKRWEKHPVAMKAAVEKHDALLRKAIYAHGGEVFRTEGDAFRAAFSTAPQALLAVIESQRAIQAEDWQAEIAPIRVRMSLHTGVGELRDNDYVGAHLNRAARILATAHGGQSLLSHATFDLVRDLLPDGITVRDLGEHRLKDLQRPEHIFQLVAPDLPSDFPPLRTLDNRPNNLPFQRSLLIGRERELDAIQQLLLRPEVGLLTLVGPGGIGKTRLALQVAAELVDRFSDGVFFVSLASANSADQLGLALAQAFGLPEGVGDSIRETVTKFLTDKHMLLVLDNFEQLVGAAPVVAGFLSAARGLKVLVTSREVLHLQGEQEYQVPPLSLPNPRRLPSLENLSQFDSVALFIQRARLVNDNFMINNDNAPAVAEICYRLDGLPLAIELAAARIRLLPPAALLERLVSRLKLLTGGARDLPVRQQTLRDTIRWSYDLLSSSEQMLFRRLAVFAGGCSLEAAEAVCNANGDLELDILDGIASLVDKSLLRQEASSSGEPRITMLETIREFALDILKADPVEAEAVASHFVDYVEILAKKADPHLRSASQRVWLDILEIEHANITAVLTRLIEKGSARRALRLIWTNWNYWYYRGYFTECIGWIDRAFALPEGKVPTFERAAGLMIYSIIGSRLGDFTHMSEYGRAAAEIATGITGPEARSVLAYAMLMEAASGIYRAEGQLYRPQVDESVVILRAVGDDWGLALGLLDVGLLEMNIGNYEAAEAALEEGMALFRKAGDDWGLSQIINSLGDIMRLKHNYPRAKELYEESLAIYRDLGVRPDVPASLHNLGYVALAQGELGTARDLLLEALHLQVSLRNNGGVAECIAGLGGFLALKDRFEEALRLLSFADSVRVLDGAALWVTEAAERERYTALVLSNLDTAVAEKAAAEGRAMTMSQAIAYAISQTA